MTKNTGTDYEVLTQEVFGRLHAQQGMVTNVERNVFLDGKSGARHQIDVTFTFEAAGVSYRTIVQCKDWGSPVKQEQVLAFKQVLDEIPGQPRGIIVARSGFQEGARTVASHHGIKLYELREPKNEDWKGLIRTLVLKLVIHEPEIRGVSFVFDEPWLQSEKTRLGVDEIKASVAVDPHGDELRFESGEVCRLPIILSKLAPPGPSDWTRIEHRFAERLMVPTSGGLLPFLPALGVTAEARTHSGEEDITMKLDHLVAYCFRDVLEDRRTFLDASGDALRKDGRT